MGFIQVLTDQNMEQVAKSINYTREHLSHLIKKGGDKSIEVLLKNKYRNEMEDFFQDREFVMEEDPEEYGTAVKIVDAEELLVHDSLVIKGMLRVILRNQASIIAGQEGKSVSSVLKQITKAVRSETSEEFDEL